MPEPYPTLGANQGPSQLLSNGCMTLSPEPRTLSGLERRVNGGARSGVVRSVPPLLAWWQCQDALLSNTTLILCSRFIRASLFHIRLCPPAACLQCLGLAANHEPASFSPPDRHRLVDLHRDRKSTRLNSSHRT